MDHLDYDETLERWLPNKEYLNTNNIFNGPWIKGLKNKIGALSFNRRIINNIDQL